MSKKYEKRQFLNGFFMNIDANRKTIGLLSRPNCDVWAKQGVYETSFYETSFYETSFYETSFYETSFYETSFYETSFYETSFYLSKIV